MCSSDLLGLALSRRVELRRRLGAGDLYVIEPRAYHADVEGLVRHYDDLRYDSGCAMNLDLQRIAIPATARNLRQRLGLEATDDAAQTRWLLQGRRIARIVVEDAGDIAAFRQVVDLPVVLSGPEFLQAINLTLERRALPFEPQAPQRPRTVGRLGRRLLAGRHGGQQLRVPRI